MQVEYVSPEKLKPWEHNPRFNDGAVDAVSKSIAQFGFNVPILCDADHTIIAGHTRWKAAKKLELDRVPIIKLQLSETQKNAFSIADNKTAEIASWDFPELASILKDLQAEEFDLSSIGFESAQLDALLVEPIEIDWAEFEENMLTFSDPDYARILVKVPLKEKDLVKQAIHDAASRLGLAAVDRGILAGQVLKKLLEHENG